MGNDAEPRPQHRAAQHDEDSVDGVASSDQLRYVVRLTFNGLTEPGPCRAICFLQAGAQYSTVCVQVHTGKSEQRHRLSPETASTADFVWIPPRALEREPPGARRNE